MARIKRQKFDDVEYRSAYADSFLDTILATQIRVLRQQRRLTQDDLAKLAGVPKSVIEAIEDVNHSDWNIQILRRLARVFDLAIVIKFEGFGSIIEESRLISRSYLERD